MSDNREAIIERVQQVLEGLPISQEEKNNVLKGLKSLAFLYPHQISFNHPDLTLREVDEDTPKFKQLCESIRTPKHDAAGNITEDHGLILPISVRPVLGRPGMYALNDGGHRLRAWQIVFGDSKPIPCMISDADDEQVMISQVQANLQVIKTPRPAIAKQIRRLLINHLGEWTIVDAARVLNLAPKVVSDYLSLLSLPTEVQERLNLDIKDARALPATVGYVLARFSAPKMANPEKIEQAKEQQRKYLEYYDQIKNESQGLVRWMNEAGAGLKKLKEIWRKPKGEVGEIVVDLQPTVRKKPEIEIELSRVRSALAATDDTVREAAQELVKRYSNEMEYLGRIKWAEAMEYVLQIDSGTREVRQKEAQDRAEKKQAVRDEKKAGKPAETIARASFLSLFK